MKVSERETSTPACARQSFDELAHVAGSLRPEEHFPLATAAICAALVVLLGAAGVVLLVVGHGSWTLAGGLVALGFSGLTGLRLTGWTVEAEEVAR